jgi:hypothetical protein
VHNFENGKMKHIWFYNLISLLIIYTKILSIQKPGNKESGICYFHISLAFNAPAALIFYSQDPKDLTTLSFLVGYENLKPICIYKSLLGKSFRHVLY